MGALDITVVLASAVLIGALGWYFFGPRRAGAARLEDGVQRVKVTVRGGYGPDLIKVRQGMPVGLVFDRQESGECTSRVVFPDLKVGAGLPAYTRTTVRLSPDRPGSFGFACGMNMIHGTLLVEPADDVTAPTPDGQGATAAPPHAPPTAAGGPVAGEEQTAADAEAAVVAERQAEIKDLTRRVTVGAVLAAPVLFAVMAHELFGADWVPGWMLDRWVQLALITLVMFYTGWPIHVTGWLTLRHRAADMNSLITAADRTQNHSTPASQADDRLSHVHRYGTTARSIPGHLIRDPRVERRSDD